MPPKKSPAYKIRIELLDMPYPAWRTVLVPAKLNLELFIHEMLAVMGWSDYHMHLLHTEEADYQAAAQGIDGMLDLFDDGAPPRDASKYTVAKVLQQDEEIFLEYDFGDGWEHRLTVEEIYDTLPPGLALHTCLAGEGACPPEDCGGIPGLEHLVDLMEHPENDPEEYEDLLDWLEGEKFEKEKFSVKETTATMQRFAKLR